MHTMKVFQLKAFEQTMNSLIKARQIRVEGAYLKTKQKYKLVFSYVLGLRQTDKYLITAPQRSPLLPRHKTLWGAVTSSCGPRASIYRISCNRKLKHRTTC